MAAANTYTVKKGDTLNAIASRYGFKNYKEAGITGYKSGNPDLIREGEVLTIGKLPSSAATVTKDTANNFINAKQEDDIAAVEAEDDAPTRGNEGKKNTGRTSLIEDFVAATGKKGIMPSSSAPELPNYEKTYNKLRRQKGVEGLEENLNDLQAEEDEIVARRRQRTQAELDKPEALNVISGRVGEVERQENERLDYIVRQKKQASAELQTANATIENIMNMRKLDYESSKSAYNDEFSQNLQLFNVVKGIRDDERSEEDDIEDAARANLNIIYGTFKDGDVDVNNLDATLAATVTKLELQAGLPTGFYKNIAASTDGKILSTTTRTTGGVKYADILMRNKDGSITAKSVYLGGDSTGKDTTDDKEEKEIAAFRADAAALIQKLGQNEISWASAFNSMKAKFPNASNELIDATLNKAEYYGVI